MDTLSRILDLLHFEATFYYVTNFQSPWGVEIPAYRNVARFHYVAQGACWVRIEGVEPRLLLPGDIIIIPHGARQILSDTADRVPTPLEQAYVEAGYDGGGFFQIGETTSVHDTQLICGHFEYEDMFRHPLVDNLPVCIVRNENDGQEFSWVKDILRFMSHTAKHQSDGSAAILKRLSEVIFIQAVRFWQTSSDDSAGFVAALADAQLSRGLKAFHDEPAGNWSVEKLARISGMSRSLFAEHFKHYLGLTPMQYVTQWRMQNARQLLGDGGHSMESVATHVGYESVAAFSKAFKRVLGLNPGEYRRRVREQEI